MHIHCLIPRYCSKQVILQCCVACWLFLCAFYPCCCCSFSWLLQKVMPVH